MEEKQAASSASPRVLMQPYPRLVSWEQYKENVVSPSPVPPSHPLLGYPSRCVLGCLFSSAQIQEMLV